MSLSVVLIDDEKPSLRVMEILLKKYPEVTVAGAYTNPVPALEGIKKLKPDAVFLDINMPEMMGMEMACKILDDSPDTDIIFATAYDQYAIKAFELHAIDYILKPVSEERLDKTINRLIKKHPANPAGCADKLMVRCLGGLVLTWDKKEPVKWRAEKTKELFAFLLHNRWHLITKDVILDSLWPEDDPDKAIRQLYNGIYYIRKALEDYGIDRRLITINSDYNIKLGEVDFDMDRLKALSDHITPGNTQLLEKITGLFTGEYLEGEDYQWAFTAREEYRVLHQDCLIKLSGYYMEKQEYEKAEKSLLRAYEIDSYNETATELLLTVYLTVTDKNKGMKHFRNYDGLIRRELGIKPGAKTIRLYQSLKLL